MGVLFYLGFLIEIDAAHLIELRTHYWYLRDATLFEVLVILLYPLHLPWVYLEPHRVFTAKSNQRKPFCLAAPLGSWCSYISPW